VTLQRPSWSLHSLSVLVVVVSADRMSVQRGASLSVHVAVVPAEATRTERIVERRSIVIAGRIIVAATVFCLLYTLTQKIICVVITQVVLFAGVLLFFLTSTSLCSRMVSAL